MLDNIRAHSVMVARVAQVLLQELPNEQNEISPPLPATDLVITGALLHDIAKTPCLKSNCDHAKQGQKICLELGYPEVAEIVREHVIITQFSSKRYAAGHFFAKELVYYADKRVLHEAIVPLAERLEYILERYGNNNPERHALIKANFLKCQKLESYIFFATSITANDIRNAVDHNIHLALSL